MHPPHVQIGRELNQPRLEPRSRRPDLHDRTRSQCGEERSCFPGGRGTRSRAMRDDAPELGDARERDAPPARVAAGLLESASRAPMLGQATPLGVHQQVRVDCNHG